MVGSVIARSAMGPSVGYVVIGRNEGARLVKCLASLQRSQSTIIYIDSGSTDGSVAAAEQAGAKVVRLDTATPFTAARARNEGFTTLKLLLPQVLFVQFIDGDCELDPDWLETARKFLSHREDVAVVCGRRRESHPQASVYNRLCDIEWDTPSGEAAACGGDSLVRVDAFESVGGFRAELIAGEEPELCWRLRERGWRIWRLDANMTRHDASIHRFGQWWARTVRSGYGYAQIGQLEGSASRMSARERTRALVWGGLFPGAILIATFIHPVACTALLIYPIQVFRIAIKRGATEPEAWLYAGFMLLAKFAELRGMLRFYWQRWRAQGINPIEYKQRTPLRNDGIFYGENK